MSRNEELYEKLLNNETSDIEPQSRIEACLLSCVNGEGSDGLPDPQSREEAYLHALSDKIASGGSGTSTAPSGPSGRASLAYWYQTPEIYNTELYVRNDETYELEYKPPTPYESLPLPEGTQNVSDFNKFATVICFNNEFYDHVETGIWVKKFTGTLDTSGTTSLLHLFLKCSDLEEAPSLSGTSQVTMFTGMFNGCNSLTSVPELDTSSGVHFNAMFAECSSLASISKLDTSNGVDFSRMFYHCKTLTSIPELDTSKGTNFTSMFYNCETLASIPELDTSKGTDFSSMFGYCTTLKIIPRLDVSSATSVNSIFTRCSALEELTMVGTIVKNQFSVSASPNLTHDSLMSIINALEDKTNDTSSTSWKVTIGATNIAKLTQEEIAIAENKGWSIK